LKTNHSSRAVFWKTVPLVSRIVFFSGVFAFFSSVGFVSLLLRYQYLSPARILITVCVTGALAAVCAIAGIARKFWLIAVVSAVEALFFAALENHYHNAPILIYPDSPLRPQIFVLAVGAIVSVVAGYILFIVFFSQQGSRFFRAQTEIALAAEIHRALVPRIERTLGPYELFGASVPSGEVGGDLVDVTGDADAWTAYVADVSGHGVSAGLLMAMFKTAVRTCALDAPPRTLLEEVHRALYPLKTGNMFVTAGFLGCVAGDFTLSLAGHPSLLHFRSKTATVQEHPTLDLPLGILPEQTFTSVPIACDTGDILLLLTDGFTEVFDKNGNELGIEPIKAALEKSAVLPLSQIFERLRQVALSAGHQDDDQTMLLVRKIL
jgi:hypothetical protein